MNVTCPEIMTELKGKCEMNETAYRKTESAFWAQYGVVPRERWLELEKPRTRVRILETSTGHPLLFMHGGPGAATIFAPIAAHLQDFRCILLDRPGCGLSPAIWYDQPSIDKVVVETIRSCLDSLNLEQATIVGSSFGGACAFWFAKQYPQRVSGIVQLGCPAFVSAMHVPLMLRLLATPVLGYALARLPMNRSGVLTFLKTMGQEKALASGKIPDAFIDWWISLATNTDTMRNERELIRHGLTPRGMRSELILGDSVIQQLRHPTYFYWGVDEPIATTDFASNLVTGMKNAVIDFIVDSGHLPWFDDPAGAAKHVRAFLLKAVGKGATPVTA